VSFSLSWAAAGEGEGNVEGNGGTRLTGFEDLAETANGGYNGEGKVVSPEAIIEIELAALSS
jgi:hypothetical protein